MNKVLLVDDEQAIRLAVRMALRREGMDVTEASDGLEALELLHLIKNIGSIESR